MMARYRVKFEAPTGLVSILGLFIVLVFIAGTNIGAYYTEQDIKEALCKKGYPQTTGYLLCKDKTIKEILK